jgi:6-pyruvoyltetrahydropterin/6-carboxytetrahydropterin synthase
MLYKVTKSIDFCYGHRLIDYVGKCAFLHGHNGRLEIELAGEELDFRGMLVDFGDIKSVVKKWVMENLDHTTILHERDPLVSVLRGHQQNVYVLGDNPTAENIATEIWARSKQTFDLLVPTVAGLPVFYISEVRLWEQPDSYASFVPEPYRWSVAQHPWPKEGVA